MEEAYQLIEFSDVWSIERNKGIALL